MNFRITLARMNRDLSVALRVRRYFDLDRSLPLTYAIRDRALGHADIVLCLLRLGCRRARAWIAELIGHPITVCPPARSAVPIFKKEKVARVRWVVRNNPRYPSTGAHARFEHFRAGRTVQECLARGATRRDYRQAVRHGWIHVENWK